MAEGFKRYHPDIEALHHGFRTESCFVCSVVDGDARLPKNIIYEDEGAIVFLDGYPRAYGYTLVAPKEHREQVTGDFTREEYIELQRLVYRVSEAVREEVRAERIYFYTFGSNEGTPMSIGTWCRYRPVYLTRSSRATGLGGVRACLRYLPMRWRPWQNVSDEGSNEATQPKA
jgi:hypothetical protein